MFTLSQSKSYTITMKDFLFLILGLTIIFGSVFLFFGRTFTRDDKIKVIKINNTNIEVEIADTPKTREKGLSGRRALSESMGMLFIFDSPSQYGFWMKDMRFGIDIVWIDENLKIVGIEKKTSPETFPQIFYPDRPIKYVLELPAGFSDKYNIGIGAVVQYNQ